MKYIIIVALILFLQSCGMSCNVESKEISKSANDSRLVKKEIERLNKERDSSFRSFGQYLSQNFDRLHFQHIEDVTEAFHNGRIQGQNEVLQYIHIGDFALISNFNKDNKIDTLYFSMNIDLEYDSTFVLNKENYI